MLENVDLIHDQFIVRYQHDAHHRLQRFALDGTPLGEIALPTLGSPEPDRSARGEDKSKEN